MTITGHPSWSSVISIGNSDVHHLYMPILNLRAWSWLFSRSYCYTVWSAIGIILLSVRLSVCLSVTLCILTLRVGVQG